MGSQLNLSSRPIRVCVFYPADPVGAVPGGIDTFIRGEINNAPDDIEYSVVGITTDEEARPVGEWMTCELQNNSFRFFPVMRHRFEASRPFVPVTISYMLRLGSVLKQLDADVLEFHRVEPLLRFRSDARPKTAVFHQNMQSLYDKNADMRWSSLPKLYFWFEDKLVPDLQTLFCVRTDAADYYRNRFANLADTCWFQPTWADPQQFRPPTDAEREASRARLAGELALDEDVRWLISVGRLDTQKDPLLMIEALQIVAARGNNDFNLLLVGEGPLREPVSKAVDEAGLSEKVRLLGLRGIDEIASLLHAADLFVMSSAYEGMPMAVIEALASGVPVATTRVGEVARAVEDRICGRIAEDRSAEKIADAYQWCLQNLADISGEPCAAAASQFSPAVVLGPVYDNYRSLAAGGKIASQADAAKARF